MAKNRKSKRQLVRDEKRARKRGRELAEQEERSSKRQRRDAEAKQNDNNPDDNELFTLDTDGDPSLVAGQFQQEFFGMLDDKEQEYFRHADEMLELNDFPTPEDRSLFLNNVYREARGKELKLASSQSCSRLMERLILLSTARQKKRLFAAFAGHFMSLITHRFASHCCEKLFLLSAPVVTEELSGKVEEADPEEEEEESPEVVESLKTSMEDLFLMTLDELEAHLSFLLSHRYGSHALRVLLVVLSGRPLNQAGTKSLLQGKGKEHVTVEGASLASVLGSEPRPVPSSFSMAISKIITDSTAHLDSTALRVLAKHPTGNPTLQLLLELELDKAAETKKAAKNEGDEQAGISGPTLLERLVPDAPGSFADEKSAASEFVNSMTYDPVGSRLLETLITKCPGKVFKGLHSHIFGPRIQSFLRNDIASYPAIRVLNRLSKADLTAAVVKTLPEIKSLVQKGRLNVVKAFFERCHVRGLGAEIQVLLQTLTGACGTNWKHIVPKLCLLDEKESKESKDEGFQPDAKNKSALISHGSQIVTTLLEIPGPPSKAIQTSLNALSPDQLLHLATSSAPTAAIISRALSVPAQVPHFHKLLVAALLPNIVEIAISPHGSGIVNAIIEIPSRASENEKDENGGSPPVVPFHQKENIMAQLERSEKELRDTWLGRNVWRSWRGDMWRSRRHDWVRWAKEVDPEDARVAAVPKPKVEEEKGKKGKVDGKKEVKPGKGKEAKDQMEGKGKKDQKDQPAKNVGKPALKGKADGDTNGQEKKKDKQKAKDASMAMTNGQEEKGKKASKAESINDAPANGEDKGEKKRKKKKDKKKEEVTA
ncbi:hypothetical protein VTJ04DRAFT_7163 [Mycothermus thermophilus]|uniref:uncharacterized protein n=1 Tax=Humicola insolens TaxID=85995 RepID=UPI0037424A15